MKGDKQRSTKHRKLKNGGELWCLGMVISKMDPIQER
jgi:hypothetical protein